MDLFDIIYLKRSPLPMTETLYFYYVYLLFTGDSVPELSEFELEDFLFSVFSYLLLSSITEVLISGLLLILLLLRIYASYSVSVSRLFYY